MNIFLTFNDPPSGIYSSQVIDVVKFIGNEIKQPIRLVAFISLRKFIKNRRKIKREMPSALVLPMVPGLTNWRKNLYPLKMVFAFMRPKVVIARSVFATNLALSARRGAKVVYDGRGAIKAEWQEYQVVAEKKLLDDVRILEGRAVLESGERIAVTEKLVEYWKSEYSYQDKKHQIIPCTLNGVFISTPLTQQTIAASRARLSLQEDDIVFVYSGSVSGWQSFELLNGFIEKVFNQHKNAKLIFLSPLSEPIKKLQSVFPARIICLAVLPAEVPKILMAGDYGLLIREKSVTNMVASPVKFPEYLVCGLKVIVSDEIGDCTDFVLKNNCGYEVTQFHKAKAITLAEKLDCQKIALGYFRKERYTKEYLSVLREQ